MLLLRSGDDWSESDIDITKAIDHRMTTSMGMLRRRFATFIVDNNNNYKQRHYIF